MVEGDLDTDGIAIAARSLAAPAGSTIVTTGEREAVRLSHGSVQDPARPVDGVRPSADSAAAAGPTVTVTWSEPLDEASVPTGNGGFRVRIGSTNGPAVTAVAVAGDTTTLSLASAIADGTQDVTLEYTPPGGAKVQDVAGNTAAAIVRGSALDVEVIPDTRAPAVSGTPTVDGTTLVVTFDEALDTGSIPAAPGGFTVSVSRDGSTVSGYDVSGLEPSASGTELTLTLAQAVRGGDVVTLAYDPPQQSPLQDRATTPNPVAAFTGADAKSVDNLTPSVTGIAFAEAAQTYAIGATIAVEATFTEAVRVTITSSDRPQVGISIGTDTRQARYVSGAGSTVLRFEYTVAEGDPDRDVIAIAADALDTPGASAIQTQAGSRAVQLGHDEVAADPTRTVDGVRPTVTSAAAAGLTVTVTWSEAIDAGSARSDAGGFVLRYDGSERPNVTAVAVDGTDATMVRLTIDATIPDGTTDATLAWSVPGSGVPIRDLAGNIAAPFTDVNDRKSVSVAPDTTAPTVTGATIDGAALTVSFDEPLDPGSIPAAPGGLTVSVTRGGSTLTGFEVSALELSVSGTELTLTLAQGVRAGDVVTLAYSPPAQDALQDRAVTPNRLAEFTGADAETVDNRTPSVTAVAFADAAQTHAIDRNNTIAIEATFTEAVQVTSTGNDLPQIGVTIGENTRQARYDSGTGSTVLRFEYTVAEGDDDGTGAIAIAADALATPGGSAIRTQAGARTVELGHDAVAADPARTVDGVRPTAQSAAAAGPTVTVTWSEPLDEASVPTGAGGFRIRIGNANGPAVTAVVVAGDTTVLSLADAIADGTQNATLAWSPPGSGTPVRDLAGNAAAAFTQSADRIPVSVPPDTRAPAVSGTPTVDGTTLVVTFDEALGGDSLPVPPGGFTVTVTRRGSPVSGFEVFGLVLSASGTELTLTLNQAVRGGDDVTVAYDPPQQSPLQDRAATPNPVAAFTGADAKSVDNLTPSVRTVAFADAAQIHAIDRNSTIAVEATFTEAVTVSGAPTIGLTIGTTTRTATWKPGQGAGTTHRFEYTVVEGDLDTDGIAIAADALATPAGSAIRTQAGSRAVHLGHDAVAADPARTVDGVRPTVSSAAVAGLTVTVTWSEAIDAASARSDAGGFVLRYGGSERPAVTAVAVDGTDATMVRLAIDATIPDGTTDATLAWSPPVSGTPVRDLAGNAAAAFTQSADRIPVSVPPDQTAPRVVSAQIDGAKLAVTFDEPLDADSIPAPPGGFTVAVTRDGSAVDGFAVSALALDAGGTVLTLTLSQAARAGDAVTLAYSEPSPDPLQDRAVAPNEVAGFTTGENNGTYDVPAVENRTPSVTGVAFAGAAGVLAIGDKVAVEAVFTEAVRVTGAPQVAVAIGASTRQAGYVSGSDTATLRFEYTVAEGDEDTDGIEIAANALTAPSGSSIVTATGSRTVQLGHDGVAADPARTVDGVRPAVVAGATGVVAAGPTLTLTWTEALDPASVPASPGGVTVKLHGNLAGPEVRSVVLEQGRLLKLALAEGIGYDETRATVDYAPGAAPLRDLAGNEARGFEGRVVTAERADNNPATGRVTITGRTTVGRTLTARVSDVADPDGPRSTPFGFTWVRIEGSDEIPVSTVRSAPSRTSTYTLTAAEAGKQVKVKVSFEDSLGNPEELESAPHPASGWVMWNAAPSCAMPDLAGRDLVWTGLVTVGTTTGAETSHGYGPGHAGGSLSDTTFTLGSTAYTIDALSVSSGASLAFSTTADLPTSATGGLVLHVCDEAFHFGDGPDADTNRDAPYSGATDYTYTWASSGLDWSSRTTRRAYLSRADTSAPVLQSIVVDAAMLTMTYDEALEATPPVPSGSDAVFIVRPVGGDPFTLSNIQAGVGPNRNLVTMTLDPPAEAGQEIEMTYAPGSATAASRVQDVTGTPAGGFTPADADRVPVRNATPESPHVDEVAIPGSAVVYRALGDSITVAITFSEPVTVRGAPTLELEIGDATRKAVWRANQPSGAVQRFRYRVVEGDLDRDGVAVRADSLEVPARERDRDERGRRAGAALSRPVGGSRAPGGRRAPDRERGRGGRAGSHGDLVRGARRDVRAFRRGQLPRADRRQRRPGGDRRRGRGGDHDAQARRRDRRRHPERHPAIHPRSLRGEDPRCRGQPRGAVPDPRHGGAGPDAARARRGRDPRRDARRDLRRAARRGIGPGGSGRVHGDGDARSDRGPRPHREQDRCRGQDRLAPPRDGRAPGRRGGARLRGAGDAPAPGPCGNPEPGGGIHDRRRGRAGGRQPHRRA